jgi:hypothetical protein
MWLANKKSTHQIDASGTTVLLVGLEGNAEHSANDLATQQNGCRWWEEGWNEAENSRGW